MTPNPRLDPEFMKLQAEAAQLHKRLEEIITEVQKSWPAGDGMTWVVTAAHTLMRFACVSYHEDEDEIA